jgi:galactose oxidase
MRLYRCRIGRTGTRLSCLMIICLLLHAHPGAGQTAGQVGAWSGVIPLPEIPIAAALLPNGKVLTWSSYLPTTFETDIGDWPSDTDTSLFDPVSETSVTTIVGNPPVDMFCPGIADLPDGRVLVNGGSSSPKTTIYDPEANTWSADADMNIPRGYNGDVLLTTGEVLTLGGSWSGPYCVEKIGEVWAANSGWGLRNGIGANPITGPDPADSPCVSKGDAYAWLFTVGNGEVFHAGPSAEMHWISTSGSGSIVSAGNRGDDAYSMNGNAVMYDIGKILKTGGAPAYSSAPATAATYLIDVNAAVADPTQPVVVQETAPMAYPRAYANGVVLPNGQVLIVGGQTYAQSFSDDNSVLVPELWDPASETFTQLAPMQTPRNYHSVALLLPGGQVFVGGGGGCGCSADHPDAEIFSPPYLFNSDGSPANRPKIVSAPSSAQLGSTVAVTTNAGISAFAILRLSAATHTVNNDQRRIPLSFTSGPGYQYTLSVPGDAGVAVPGYYLLFAITPNGTPSVGLLIHIG